MMPQLTAFEAYPVTWKFGGECWSGRTTRKA